MRLFCTKKFLTELRLKKADIPDMGVAAHPFDNWYAHIFYLYPRRKCAIFMHVQTKFCFVAYDRNRQQLNDVKGIFRKGLGRAFFDENYSSSVIKLFNDHLEDIQIGTARDRHILGFINNRIQGLKWIAEEDFQDGRVRDESIAGLALRRSPMSTEKWGIAVELMKDLLLSSTELKGAEICPVGYKHEKLEKFFDKIRH